MGLRGRKRVPNRAVPLFAFIDHDVSDQPFHVDRLPFTGLDEVRSLIGALVSLLDWPGGGATPQSRIFVTDPSLVVYEVIGFESELREAEWTQRAREMVVTSGAAGMAAIVHDAEFRRRYGAPTVPELD